MLYECPMFLVERNDILLLTASGREAVQKTPTEVYRKFVICCRPTIHREVTKEGRCGAPKLQWRAAGNPLGSLLETLITSEPAGRQDGHSPTAASFGNDQTARFVQVSLKHTLRNAICVSSQAILTGRLTQHSSEPTPLIHTEE